MKNSVELENRFKQALVAGVRLGSPLHVAFSLAFAMMMLAFGAGLVYSLAERGTLPDIMLNHLSEANALAQRGDYGGATEAYRRAAMVAPDDLQALLRLRTVAAVNEDDENVWWALERALQVDPRDEAVQMLAADAYFEIEEYEKARQHYTAAVRLAPQSVDAAYKLGYLHVQLGDEATARRWFEQTLESDPDHMGARQFMISIGSEGRP